MLSFVITLLFLLLGISCGFIVAIIAREELLYGKRYFRIIYRFLLGGILLLFAFSFIYSHSYLTLGLFLVVLLLLLFVVPFRFYVQQILLYGSFFVFSFFLEQQLLFAAQTFIFLYGFPVATFLYTTIFPKLHYDERKA